jgi:Family of unknown function (DUF6868)
MSNSTNTDQMLEVIGQVLIRCVVMGVVALLFWWAGLSFMGDLVYGLHSKLAPMTRQQFNVVHYAGMLTTKAAVSLLFFFPVHSDQTGNQETNDTTTKPLIALYSNGHAR